MVSRACNDAGRTTGTPADVRARLAAPAIAGLARLGARARADARAADRRLPGPDPAPIPTDIPNNHLGYALTWFGLAAGLVGVYVASLRRARSRA